MEKVLVILHDISIIHCNLKTQNTMRNLKFLQTIFTDSS